MPTTSADVPPEIVSLLLTALDGATDDLSASLARASAPELAGPSLLDGWSRAARRRPSHERRRSAGAHDPRRARRPAHHDVSPRARRSRCTDRGGGGVVVGRAAHEVRAGDGRAHEHLAGGAVGAVGEAVHRDRAGHGAVRAPGRACGSPRSRCTTPTSRWGSGRATGRANSRRRACRSGWRRSNGTDAVPTPIRRSTVQWLLVCDDLDRRWRVRADHADVAIVDSRTARARRRRRRRRAPRQRDRPHRAPARPSRPGDARGVGRHRARRRVQAGVPRALSGRQNMLGLANTSRTSGSKCASGSVSYSGSNAIWSHSSAKRSATAKDW